MGRIKKESIEKLLQTIHLPDYIGQTVQLRRSAGRYLGLCPFHNESSPSFFVMDDHYHCYGCGAHGKAIDFEMSKLGSPFPEAVESLARRFGFELEYELSRNGSDEADLKRRRLGGILQEIAAFYERCLYAGVGRGALTYLQKERGLLPQTLTTFGIGFAPLKNTLSTLAQKHGWQSADLLELGMLKESTVRAGAPHFDFFRSRVIVPIHDEKGLTVGFGGRILSEERVPQQGTRGPKYLNSSESFLFSKSKILFNLNRARKKMLSSREAVVVEGYMDAIALYQAGVENVVAVLGTSLSIDHVKLLSRYVDRVFLCFDSDEAGQRAMERSFEIAWPLNLVSLFGFSLIGAKDPDELVRTPGGINSFTTQMRNAEPLLFGVLRRATRNVTYREERLRQVTKEVLPLIEKSKSVSQKQTALKDISEFLGLRTADLVRSFKGLEQHRTPLPETQQSETAHRFANQQKNLATKPVFFLKSVLELRLLVFLSFSELSDLPMRLRNAYTFSESTSDRSLDDLILAAALQKGLSSEALIAIDDLMGYFLNRGMPEKKERAATTVVRVQALRLSGEQTGPSLLIRALDSFFSDDLETLESMGFAPQIFARSGAVAAKFRPDKSVLDPENVGFLQFLRKDAELAALKGSIASQVSKLLLDLEIVYLDSELAQWTSKESHQSVVDAVLVADSKERYRLILKERARRLTWLQQEVGS